MKREELIAYDKWLTRRKWGTGEIISPEKAADLYLAEHPLPPAEGAEETAQRCPVCGGNGLVPNGFYNQTSGDWASCSNVPETCRSCKGTGVVPASQPQPTAEGAEEFLLAQRNGNDSPITVAISPEGWVFKMVVKAMERFATLHAQKIADKMVEEQGEMKYWDEFNKQYQGNCIGKTLTQILEAFWYYCNGQKTKTKKLMS